MQNGNLKFAALGSAPFDWSDLSPSQVAPVRQVAGPLLINAGAGTGKTRTIIYRIAYVIDQGSVSAHSILAVTFTRKAAREIVQRLEKLLGADLAQQITAVTYHALGLKMLQAYGDRLGYHPKKLVVYDQAEARKVLVEAMQEVGANQSIWDPQHAADALKMWKDNRITPADFESDEFRDDLWNRTMRRIFERYLEKMRAANALDQDDLIYQPCLLLEIDEVRSLWQELFRYITVDEFQDTSIAQYGLVQMLAWNHRNLCCVGSHAQAIYSWRGAQTETVLRYLRVDFPEIQEYALLENYRSTEAIVRTGEALVAEWNYGPTLNVHRKVGAPVQVSEFQTEWEEADFLAREAQQLLADGYRGRNIAILYRTWAQAHVIEQAFLHAGIPYGIVGDRFFIDRAEVRDLLAYLRIVYYSNPTPDTLQQEIGSVLRILNRPERGLGRAVLRKIQKGNPGLSAEMLFTASEREDLNEEVKEQVNTFLNLLFDIQECEGTVTERFDWILDSTGYREWLGDSLEGRRKMMSLEMLRSMLAAYESAEDPLAEFYREVELGGGAEMGFGEDERFVTLSTIHAAKGLEWPIVFLVGVEEHVFPNARAIKTQRGLEEEYRLAYVAVTRACYKLYITYARARTGEDGKVIEHSPSPFLGKIPREWVSPIQTRSHAPPHPSKRASAEEIQFAK
ncbi:MAG TPA: UvrD-helicase domain-containing protein [Anaerolineae bacterium]|nr:UvrD-helicase domain-containing protein [Anaerolineae bacterium]